MYPTTGGRKSVRLCHKDRLFFYCNSPAARAIWLAIDNLPCYNDLATQVYMGFTTRVFCLLAKMHSPIWHSR